MPPPAILDVAQLNTSQILYTREQIQEKIPQRFEFAQLDAVIHVDATEGNIAGIRDIRPDEWWCRGHLPGRPIFPGVLMMECAAQLAAFFREIVLPPDNQFMGFGGMDNAKFRGAVIPPARIIMLGKAVEKRARRFICDMQGYVDGVMVFEGRVTGMPIKN